ncbi:hypothetical protein [Bathymodiolus thermophilus thioautotrophic gill symbiont]|uniref:hypothetical protein n=1 Tax=Bathymodiolus thermophilus thioautotrophic gill symbiont TaxID=2360 RepID=UPI0011162778|nr:hypothetical protein [Bathymodiolus thermophilus thioautotrophic gill symbiont]
MNTLHCYNSTTNLAIFGLDSSQMTSYFSTLTTCLVNRGFFVSITFIAIIEKNLYFWRLWQGTLIRYYLETTQKITINYQLGVSL